MDEQRGIFRGRLTAAESWRFMIILLIAPVGLVFGMCFISTDTKLPPAPPTPTPAVFGLMPYTTIAVAGERYYGEPYPAYIHDSSAQRIEASEPHPDAREVFLPSDLQVAVIFSADADPPILAQLPADVVAAVRQTDFTQEFVVVLWIDSVNAGEPYFIRSLVRDVVGIRVEVDDWGPPSDWTLPTEMMPNWHVVRAPLTRLKFLGVVQEALPVRMVVTGATYPEEQ